MTDRDSHENSLDALFRAYRESCEAPEPSVNFMPHLWQKIEARQSVSFVFGRLARGFVTAAVAVSLAMGSLMFVVSSQTSPMLSAPYVEVLAAQSTTDVVELAEPIQAFSPVEGDLL